MHFGTKKALILAQFLTISSAFFFDSPDVWASRKLNQQSRITDIERSLSANESLLNRFINEREQILKSDERLTSPHIYRNKLTIINNKITFLEQEIKRTKPRVQQSRAALAKSPKKAALPAPVTVSPQNKIQPPPRKGYFLAYSSSLAKFLSPDKKDQRDPPVQGVVPIKPLAVESIAPSELPDRQSAQRSVMPEKVEPIVAIALPERQQAVLLETPPKPKVEEAPIVLAPAETEVRRYFPVSDQETMKDTMAILKQPDSDKTRVRTARTGRDWKQMSAAEKEIYVLSVMGNLSRRDVFLMRSYGFYIKSVDKSLAEDPSLESEYVHKVIMNNAYASEPESRKDLERVWR